MSKTTITRDFAYFLKSNGVYSNFVYYAKRNKDSYYWFDWNKTREGHAYWARVFNNFDTWLVHKYITTAIEKLKKN